MKRINVRQLNREFKKIIEDLPVIITVRGEDKYKLSDINSETEKPEPEPEPKPKYKPVPDVKAKLWCPPPDPVFNKKAKMNELKEKTKKTMEKKTSTGPKKYSKLEKTKKPEDFCPKHGGRLMGGSKYTCGCIKKN